MSRVAAWPRALPLALCAAVLTWGCGDKKSSSKDRDKDEQDTKDDRPILTMDEKFELFMKENSELADLIEKEKSAAGATKIWDARKVSLRKRYDAIKDARGFQVTEETKTKFGENVTACTTKVCLKISLDATESASFKKLCDDYTALFGVEDDPSAAKGAAPSP